MTAGWLNDWEAAKEAREDERMINTQLTKWRELQDQVKGFAALEREADKALDDFVSDHLRDYPLSPAACNALRDRVRAGLPLCCKDGAAFLAAVVDPIWAEHLNEWAYDALTCRGGSRHVEEELRRLNQKLTGNE